MTPEWIGVNEHLPPPGELVLAQLEAGGCFRETVAVAYWKQTSVGPMWVTPGHDRANGRQVTHWSACLPNPINAPGWIGTQGAEPVCPSAAAACTLHMPDGRCP